MGSFHFLSIHFDRKKTRAKAFLVWDQFGAVTGITMREDPLDTRGLRIFAEDSRDPAFNGWSPRL